jgi:hypothetical protein
MQFQQTVADGFIGNKVLIIDVSPEERLTQSILVFCTHFGIAITIPPLTYAGVK